MFFVQIIQVPEACFAKGHFSLYHVNYFLVLAGEMYELSIQTVIYMGKGLFFTMHAYYMDGSDIYLQSFSEFLCWKYCS